MPTSPTFSSPACGAAATLATVALLAGCGGGGESGGATPTVQALAAATTPADATTWTPIASEGASYTLSGTQTVRYGAGTAWITMQVTGGGNCTNAAFGSDPAYGVVKTCQVASTDNVSTWSKVASEGQAFTISGTGNVRYGAGTSFVTRSVSGSGTCSNAYFGSDPAYGVVKECDLDTSVPTTTTWTQIATENAGFTVSGSQTVRYGAGTSFITKTVTGSGTCSNAYFGSDPAYGVVKECDVASASNPTVAAICTPPATPADTSAVVATVGNGSPASCTEAALRAAVNAYATVKFNCGSAAVTIPIASTISLPTERDTLIDGGGTVTLDGQGLTRILSLERANYRANNHLVTLQHIALINGKAPGGGYVAPSPTNPSCAYGYRTGGGGAIYVSDAKLYVFDTDFRSNAAATPGPDIGGGAVYAAGSLDVLIAGSRFSGNSGSNGGAINTLNSNLRIYNSTFAANLANGNTDSVVAGADTSACPGVGGPGQSGAGGGGGAVSMDGGDDTDVTICGATFSGNTANTQAGALQRVADLAARKLTIDRSAFVNNAAKAAGAVYLQNQVPLNILASTFSGNQAVYAGVGQLQSSTFNIVNSTFANNTATHGVGGAFLLGGNSAASVMQNVTFAGNRAAGGPGYFSAALFGDSAFAINNSLFANNTSDDPYNPMQCGFSPISGSSDLQWPRNRSAGGAADTPCVSGITFADPLLGTLADNGGPTLTLLPASTSPLRGAGRNCPATDQRGNPRSGASCTIGAVE